MCLTTRSLTRRQQASFYQLQYLAHFENPTKSCWKIKKLKEYTQNQDDDLLILSMRPTLLHHLHYVYIYQATPHVLLGVS